MFGVRLSSLFTSRWMALAWAVLICLYAVSFVGERRTNDEAAAQDEATAQAVNTAVAALH